MRYRWKRYGVQQMGILYFGCHMILESVSVRHQMAGPGMLKSQTWECQRQILIIRWQNHVRNAAVTNLTGLPPVMDQIVKRRNSIFGHIARMPSTIPVHQAPTSALATSNCLSVDCPTNHRSVVPDVHTSNGWTELAKTILAHPSMCGEMLSDEVILERRDGPRRPLTLQRVAKNGNERASCCHLANVF